MPKKALIYLGRGQLANADEPIEEIEEEPDDEPEVALAQPEEDKPQ